MSVRLGGVIRNSKGEWIQDYNRFLGECSVATAKIMGLTRWTTYPSETRIE
ncbi:hypothetical protein J1N35_026345 [Gossypium stocksii]|uniref:RNase H type-1 domain-containing protein n=1 Tax=Gossypium stocksii TaxID=47602 RepID=A0A9D3V853_9ROSI|nr:hypothetical protein J1N35_026345 [Gossypium stocksii]